MEYRNIVNQQQRPGNQVTEPDHPEDLESVHSIAQSDQQRPGRRDNNGESLTHQASLDLSSLARSHQEQMIYRQKQERLLLAQRYHANISADSTQ
jgi:hypothetical protein